MILSRYHIALVAASLFAVAVRATDTVIAVIDGFVDRCVEFVVSAFKMDAPCIAIDGPSFDRTISREPLSRSLLESLRHEKGVPRSGAARNI